MDYNDEQILNVDDYEKIAKVYASALKNKGFMIVHVDTESDKAAVEEVFKNLYTVKSLLFGLGGFLNTGKFYSLNERQIKKLSILFDYEEPFKMTKIPFDKTKALLSFLSNECLLIKNLINLVERSNYELQIKDIIFARLNLLSGLLKV